MLSSNGSKNRSAIADNVSSTRINEPPSLIPVDDDCTTSETANARVAAASDLNWPLPPRRNEA